MNQRTPDDTIPDHRVPDDRVPDILARAAELDRDRRESSSIEALRAIAVDAGISVSSLEAALEEYAAKSGKTTPVEDDDEGKDPTTGTLLALFLGGFGAHRFYLGDKWGFLYLLLIWTLIPSVLGIIEAFFMPERVRAYNRRTELIEAVRTHRLIATKGEEAERPSEPQRQPCPQCAELILPNAKICRFCRSDLL